MDRTETNGYLDPGQTIINYAVREIGCPLSQVLEDDPNRMLMAWLRLRRRGRHAAIAGIGIGSIGMLLGVFAGAMPLTIIGIGLIALDAIVCKIHADAEESILIEMDLLDAFRPVLQFLVSLEQQGINSSNLVSMYDRLLKFASTNQFAASDPEQLMDILRMQAKQMRSLDNLKGEYPAQSVASLPASPSPSPPTASPSPRPASPSPSPSLFVNVKFPELPELEVAGLGVENFGDVKKKFGSGSVARKSSVANTFDGDEDDNSESDEEEFDEEEEEFDEEEEEFDEEEEMEGRTLSNAWSPSAIAPSDIALDLAKNLKSTLIVGAPGAGKGITTAFAIRNLKRMRPDIQIWVIDPKAESSEACYWTLADQVFRRKLHAFFDPLDTEKFIEDATEFVQRFESLKGPKLLIVDEVVTIKNKLKNWYQNVLAPGCHALCSMGRATETFVWMLSQSPNAADFGMSAGMRNVYRRLLLITIKELGLLSNASTFFSGKPDMKLFSATGRVFYDSTSDRWGATPIYDLNDLLDSPASTSRTDNDDRLDDRFIEWLRQNQPATPEQVQSYFKSDISVLKEVMSRLAAGRRIAMDQSKRFFFVPNS